MPTQKGLRVAANRNISRSEDKLVARMHFQVELAVVARRLMRAPHLDILKRQSDGSFVWIEAVSDLRVAEDRISQLACAEPGEYFVFDQRTQQIVAKIAKPAMR
jgi:hypothetical protein